MDGVARPEPCTKQDERNRMPSRLYFLLNNLLHAQYYQTNEYKKRHMREERFFLDGEEGSVPYNWLS